MKFNLFTTSSILKKFIIFNLIVFFILGIVTILYLNKIKPNLVKNRSVQHENIIKNTLEHINRLNIEFTKEKVVDFLLSTRFLFQNLDRVQLYDLDSNLLGDTDTLDLAQEIFIKSKNVQESSIDKLDESINKDESAEFSKSAAFNTKNYIKEYSKQDKINKKTAERNISKNQWWWQK